MLSSHSHVFPAVSLDFETGWRLHRISDEFLQPAPEKLPLPMQDVIFFPLETWCDFLASGSSVVVGNLRMSQWNCCFALFLFCFSPLQLSFFKLSWPRRTGPLLDDLHTVQEEQNYLVKSTLDWELEGLLLGLQPWTIWVLWARVSF